MPKEPKGSGVYRGGRAITFSRPLGLFDASMIGVGAMIGAGIFVLTGIAAGEAGPASFISFALCGLVTLFTALSYAELSSAIPRAGGGYSFIREAFPTELGFISGWILWFAYIIACSLYALGFASYFLEFIRMYTPQLYTGFEIVLGQTNLFALMVLAIGIPLILLNIKGTAITGKTEDLLTMSKIAILGIFVIFGLGKILGGDVSQSLQNFTPLFPKGYINVIMVMGLIFIAFEGYDLITTASEEIKNPEKNIPRAIFISIAITLTIYLLVVFVSLGALDVRPSWEFLGKYQERAIIKAAENFMPKFGVVLILLGGILATVSALNATILASSRVAFSMGRDKWLPEIMGKIYHVTRTPFVAIMATGVIFLTLALVFPIKTVGSAASLMFLLNFILVNLSVIVLRRKEPYLKRTFKIPLYPWTPIIGILTCAVLALYQYKFDPKTWYITLGWMAVGLFMYYAYFEKKSEIERPQVFDYDVDRYPMRGHRILIPFSNPENVTKLLDFAIPICQRYRGGIIGLICIKIPPQLPVQEGFKYVHQQRHLLIKAEKYCRKLGVDFREDIRICHRVEDGILSSARDERANLIVMGWKGFTTRRERIFGEIADKVIRYSPCDLILIKFEGDNIPPRKILFPTAGGPNARLAAKFVEIMAKSFGSQIYASYVVPKGADENTKRRGFSWIEETMKVFGLDNAEKTLIESASPAAGIVKKARDVDLIIMGASRENVLKMMLFGDIPDKVAKYSKTSVMVVKGYEGAVKSWFKRVFG